MIKSHDFELLDPVFPTNSVLRRILVLRDPVYCLTSYWSLQVIEHNQDLLKAHGINPVKVYHLHEKPVLQMVYGLIDSLGSVPCEADLVDFLRNTKNYMLGFIHKWGRCVPKESIVRYEEVKDFAMSLIESLAPRLPADAQHRFENWKDRPENQFHARSSPFLTDSRRMSEHLSQHAELFCRFAEEIRQEDQTGCFASACQLGQPFESDSNSGNNRIKLAG
jgi:hypothetical protein